MTDLLAPLAETKPEPSEAQRYRAWVETLPCLKCFVVTGVRNHGCVAVAPPGDTETLHLLPICASHRTLGHDASPAQKSRGEEEIVAARFWEKPGIDAAAAARALRSARYDREAAKRVFDNERARVLASNKRGTNG